MKLTLYKSYKKLYHSWKWLETQLQAFEIVNLSDDFYIHSIQVYILLVNKKFLKNSYILTCLFFFNTHTHTREREIKYNELRVCQWSERLGFNPRSNHTKDSKMVFDATLLNTQHYKVRIKSKVEQSKERSRAPPYTTL